jgi:hypothetical protein
METQVNNAICGNVLNLRYFKLMLIFSFDLAARERGGSNYFVPVQCTNRATRTFDGRGQTLQSRIPEKTPGRHFLSQGKSWSLYIDSGDPCYRLPSTDGAEAQESGSIESDSISSWQLQLFLRKHTRS